MRAFAETICAEVHQTNVGVEGSSDTLEGEVKQSHVRGIAKPVKSPLRYLLLG
jgi:hypothetical protein